MSRYTRTPVTSGFEVQSQLNQNFSDIQDAIDDTLSRVGDQPNHMITDLDMNSYRIYNLPYATSNTEPVTYAQWLGSAGSTTVSGFFKWTAVATASQTLFSGITPTYTPGSNNIDVYINGVYQHPGAYTETSSSSITFSSGLDAGDAVLVNIKAVDALDTLSTVARVERKIATASQTLFTLTTLTYNIGANNLSVYVNGLRMVAGVDYTETSSSSVTFTVGLSLNDEVVFVTGEVTSGSVASDANAITYKQSASAVTRTAQARLQERVSVRDFGAVGDGVTDDTAAIQAAHNSTAKVFYPEGTYKITQSISLGRGARVCGDNMAATDLYFYGCDGFTLNAATATSVVIEGVNIRSVSSGGSADPKTHTGISCPGTGANNINFLTIRRVYLQGFNRSIDLKYVWNSVIDDVSTINCNYGVRLFGQSVNNAISNSRLLANSGTASISLESDGAVVGEGLAVTSSLLAQGAYGVKSDNNFLSFSLVGCIVDLITDVALKFSDMRSASCAGCWVYATNKCVEFGNLGSPTDVKFDASGCHMTVTSTTGKVIDLGSNVRGVSLSGGSMVCSTSGYLVYSSASEVSVRGIHGTNPGANKSFFFAAGSDITVSATTGDDSVGFSSGVPSSGQNLLCSASITGATGAKVSGFGCTTSRTGTGTYVVTYSDTLSSALVIPNISIRRTGQASVTFEITAFTTASLTFETYNAAGAKFDPTDIYVSVFS